MSALLALAAAMAWGSSDFAAGYASRKSSAISVVILTHFAAVVVLLCFAVDLGPIWTMFGDVARSVGPGDGGSIRWSGPGVAGSPTIRDIGWGVAAGLGGGFGAMLLFRGLGKGTMAVVAPITATGAASIPVLFGLLTGDSITVLGIAGIALALIAIVLVSLSGPDDSPVVPLTVPDDWSTQFRLPPPTGLAVDPAAPAAFPAPAAAVHAPATSHAPAAALLAPPRLAAPVASSTAGLPAALPAPNPPSASSPLIALADSLRATARRGRAAAPVALRPPAPDAFAPPSAAPSAASPPAPPAAPLPNADTVAPPLPPPPIEMDDTPKQRMGIHDGELRMPLRTIREAVLALVATAVLSAAAIASQPIGALVDGEEMTARITATLVFALVIVGLATFALNSVKPIFDFSNLSLHRDLHDRGAAPDAISPQAATNAAPDAAADAAPGSGSTLSWRAIVRQPGVPEALFSGLGFGLFFVFIYRAGADAGQWPLVSARAVSVLLFVAIALVTTTAILPERGSRAPVVLAGLLDAFAAIFFVLSTRIGLLSVGAVLAALYPVATVVLARVITKERIRREQMAGLVLALVAVGLLAA